MANAQDSLYDTQVTDKQEKSKVDCKTCKKPFKCLLQHLKKSTSCRGTYTQEEMDCLHEISKEISRQKLSDTKIRYYRRNKEKIGKKNAKYYLENKEKNLEKKYEKGIGQGLIQSLHEDDFQKFQAVKEWIAMLKKEQVLVYFLKHIYEKFNDATDLKSPDFLKNTIPLRLQYSKELPPALVKLLKFLDFTPPSKERYRFGWDPDADLKQHWSYPSDWKRHGNGLVTIHEIKSRGLVTIHEMKSRFIKEMIDSWDQTDADRGPDQWLDQIDCRGCNFSFDNLLQHIESTSKCQSFYHVWEMDILHQQKWIKIESKKETERHQKAIAKINHGFKRSFGTSVQNTHSKDNEPHFGAASQEKNDDEFDKTNEYEVPKHLMPFAKINAQPDPTKKQPIKVGTAKDREDATFTTKAPTSEEIRYNIMRKLF